jgi:hypothetical protein
LITFKMRRRGEFIANFTTTKNQCGSGGQQLYRYVCEIEVGESLDDHGFILDNYRVQGYFDREYAKPQIARSCERIADIAVGDFRTMLEEQGREIHRVSVTISGSDVAGLTATWKRGAQKDEADLGIADVWHNGTKSYYRAKLLKKLTTAEALFDPTEEPVEIVKIDLGAIENRVLSNIKPRAYDNAKTEPVCDFCKEKVESDRVQDQTDGAQWIHKHGSYRCKKNNVATVSGYTVATVNGSENVSGKVSR